MSEPFALLDKDWLGSQSHEVTLDDQGGVLLAEKEGRLAVRVGILLVVRQIV